MRLASKAALLLSPDLRAVANDVRKAEGLVYEARLGHSNHEPDAAQHQAEVLREAHDRLRSAMAALEGREPPNRG